MGRFNLRDTFCLGSNLGIYRICFVLGTSQPASDVVPNTDAGHKT